MNLETSVAIISVAFAALVIFFIATLLKVNETLESVKKDLHEVSTAATQVMQKVDALATDMQAKAKGMMDLVTVSVILFNKIRAAVRRYAK